MPAAISKDDTARGPVGQSVRVLFCAAVLGVNALTGLLAVEGAAGPAALAVDTLRGISALALVLFVPGLAFLPLIRRLGWMEQRDQGFYGLLFAALTTLSCHVLSHKIILALSLPALYWNFWWAAVGCMALGVILSAWVGAPVTLSLPRKPMLWSVLCFSLVLLAFVLITSPPRFVDQDDYLSEDLFSLVRRLDFKAGGRRAPGITLDFGKEWKQQKDGIYELDRRWGAVKISNATNRPARINLKLVLKNLWPDYLLVKFFFNNQVVAKENVLSHERGAYHMVRRVPAHTVFVYPRFDYSRHPRNWFPNLRLVSPTLEVPPGEHELRLEVRDEDVFFSSPGPRLRLFNFSFLDGPSFYKGLRRHFFIGDLGDIRETLDLASGFKSSPIQRTFSYKGDDFDGGGPTSISDEPPGHHFLCFLAQTFHGDSVTAISQLYLLELALLLILALHMVTWQNPHLRWWHTLPLLGLFSAYTLLCRMGLESNAPDTLFLLAWLCAMRVYLDGRTRLALLLVGLTFMIHIPAPQCALFLGLAALIATRKITHLGFIIKAFLVMALILLGRYLIIASLAGYDGAFYSGQAYFMGEERLNLAKAIFLHGQWGRLLDLQATALSFARLLLLASCGAVLFFAVAWLLSLSSRGGDTSRGDSTGWVMLLFGLLYWGAFSLVDAQRAHHVGPMALPMMLAALRRVGQVPKPRIQMGLIAFMVLVCLAVIVFLLMASPDQTETFARFHIRQWLY